MTTKFKQNVQINGQLNATTLVGDGSALTGLPAGYSNADVDTHLNQNNPTQDFVLSWNGSDYAWVSNLGGGGITHIIEDTTPQLGGNLDAQAFDITTTGKILYSNVYATEGDLPNATTYHGMFAHVHATGAGYFAHGGNWIKLANDSQLSSYQTTAGLNSAIDTHLNQSGPTSGYVLSWNGSDYAWVSNAGGGGGTLSNVVEDTTPQLGGNLDAQSNNISNVGTLTVENINTTGSGSTNISAGANIELDATNRVLVTDTPFRLASLTTTQRNAIASPANGDMIYNSTNNQIESYENSSWTGSASGSGPVTYSVQNITGPGAINLTDTVTLITTTGADAYTLADGVEGQLKIISMKVNGGNATVTPTNFVNGTSILFNNVEDTITMVYQTTGWVLLARQNATVQ